jgi:hypothetical protein
MAEITVQLREVGRFPPQLRGVEVQPLFPGSDDPEMRSWFRVRVSEGRDADELARELLGRAEVTAAYVRPPESAP